MRAAIPAMLALLATGCQWVPGTRQNAESIFVQTVKSEMDRTLFDYPTARFRDVRMASGGEVICGEVNSKNRMGAYVGWQPLSAAKNSDGQAVVDIGGSASYPAIYCRVARDQQALRSRDISDRMTYRR